MDRRFVALKATDDQPAAVAASASTTASALPVTDTAGMLIGIVTIDDVLDVAEAAAPKRSSISADRKRSTSRTWRLRSA